MLKEVFSNPRISIIFFAEDGDDDDIKDLGLEILFPLLPMSCSVFATEE